MEKNNKSKTNKSNKKANSASNTVSNVVSNINDYDSLPEVANSVVNTAYSHGKNAASKSATNCKSKNTPTDCR